MTPLERRASWLLRSYPAWYRRDRAPEMLSTLLEASPPGRTWPTLRDARALIAGGMRVRGKCWLLSILWVALGAAITGYTFFVTTKPFTNADFWIPLWGTEPQWVSIAAYLTVATWVVLTLPVLVAGLSQLRGRGVGLALRAAAWVGVWAAGLVLMYQAGVWGEYPNPDVTSGPAVVSWGELALVVVWLALGAVMTLILASPSRDTNPSGSYARVNPGH